MSRARAANSAFFSPDCSHLLCFAWLPGLSFVRPRRRLSSAPDRVSARPSRTDAVKAAHLRAREGLAFTVSSTVASLRCRVETVSTNVSSRRLQNSDNGAASTKRRSLIYAATITTRMGRDHRPASIDEREGLGRAALQPCDTSVARPKGGSRPSPSCRALYTFANDDHCRAQGSLRGRIARLRMGCVEKMPQRLPTRCVTSF